MKRFACLVIVILASTITGFCQSGTSAQSKSNTAQSTTYSEPATPKKPAVLNHIALYVENLKTSTNFYQHIIGLDTIPEPFHDGRHTWFGIGKQGHLHIISGASTKTAHDKNTHLCFSVPSVQEFTSILKKNNITFENWAGEKNAITNRVDGVKQIYFTDPDGYWIEINDDEY